MKKPLITSETMYGICIAAILLLSFIFQILFIIKTVPANTSVYNLTFGFGDYIENIFKLGEFKGPSWISPISHNNESLRASRMPFHPLAIYALAFFNKNQQIVAFLKIALFDIIMIFVSIKLHKSSLARRYEPKAIIAFALILLSPMYVKHMSALAYEEGFIYLILPFFAFFFTICSYDLFYCKLENNIQLFSWSALSALATCLSLLKQTFIIVLVICWVLLFIFILKYPKNRFILSAFALSVILLLSWGGRNYIVTGRFTIGSSYYGESLYRGNNSDGLKIYPDTSLDELFNREYITLSSGKIVHVNKMPSFTAFSNEWSWNDYYQSLAFDWAKKNPQLWLEFISKKAYVFFIDLKPCPLKPSSLSEAPSSNEIRNKLVFISLGLIRIMEILFLLNFILLAITGNPKIMLVLGLMLGIIAAYALPCLLGFAYERHIEGLLPILVVFNLFLFHMVQVQIINKKNQE
jgi:hypothetical protein